MSIDILGIDLSKKLTTAAINLPLSPSYREIFNEIAKVVVVY